MTIRITVVFDDITNKRARKIQSKITAEVSKSVSFSRIVNVVMNAGMDHVNIEKVIKELNNE